MRSLSLHVVVVIAALLLVGCSGRTDLMPNPDPALRKSTAQFAADAAKRHPFPADLPRGGEAIARAQVGYTLNQLEIVNLSDEIWYDVEIWVNQTYVVFVPKMKPNELKRIKFTMLFDDKGQYFPVNNSKTLVNSVEIRRDDKIYTVRSKQAD